MEARRVDGWVGGMVCCGVAAWWCQVGVVRDGVVRDGLVLAWLRMVPKTHVGILHDHTCIHAAHSDADGAVCASRKRELTPRYLGKSVTKWTEWVGKKIKARAKQGSQRREPTDENLCWPVL